MWLTQSDKIFKSEPEKPKDTKKSKKKQVPDVVEVPKPEKPRVLYFVKGMALVNGSYYWYQNELYRLHHFTKTKVYLELLDKRLQPLPFSAGRNAQAFSKEMFQWDSVKMAGPVPTREEILEMILWEKNTNEH